MVDSLEVVIRNTSGGVIVAANFNARAVHWGMPHKKTIGWYILEMAVRTANHYPQYG